MTASYISARFEKADLSASVGKIRCIVRNLDDGAVPPVPASNYFPTSPDLLRNFLVVEYVNDTIGERLSRIATLTDINTLTPTALTGFECPTANFTGAGVIANDTLEITPPFSATWASEEHPASPFRFVIASVVSATRLLVYTPIPSALYNVSWSVLTKTSGTTNGFVRRATFPAPGALLLDSRMNLLFDDVASVDAFVSAAKASLDALAASSTTSTLTSESYSTP